MRTNVDVIVVGSGACGGWAAKELTGRGRRVLLLDAGPRLEPAEVLGPPVGAAEAEDRIRRRPIQSRNRVFRPGNHHLYVDDVDHPYVTPDDAPFNWIRSRQSGGRTLLWSGVALRMSDLEFEAAEQDGFAPSWPIGLDTLAPHYERVETFLGVRGCRDGLAQLPDGAFLPPQDPWPVAVRELAGHLRSRLPDRRMVQVRRVEMAPPANGRHSPSSSMGSTIVAAERTGLLELRCDAVVTRILTDASSGRASGVQFVDRVERTQHEVRARVVVLAASSLESVRLLLNSAGTGHPHGLANSSGTLGRYLVDHVAGPEVLAAGPYLGPDQVSFLIPRFRNLRPAGRAAFLRGYSLVGMLGPVDTRTGLKLEMSGEVLPRPENRVTLDPARRDPWGVPAARIEYRYSTNEQVMADDALAAMDEVAHVLGFDVVKRRTDLVTPGTRAHELGGARMGADRRTSVLNSHNQAWDVPNLFVVDGACFPTAGYQNPTLTMLAVADRASRYVADRLADGDL